MRHFDGIVALLMVVGAVSFLVYFFVADFKTALLFTIALVSVSYIKQYFSKK